MKKLLILFIVLFWVTGAIADDGITITYYVDSAGSDTAPYNTWAKASNQLEDVAESYVLNAGDVIYCRGTITVDDRADFATTDGGENVHPGTNADKTLEIEPITLTGSTATFTTTPVVSAVTIGTDYLWVVNSFRGNSGAYEITALNGNIVTVDTSDLPGGTFVDENSADSPWVVKGAIIKPVRVIGCNAAGTPRAGYVDLVDDTTEIVIDNNWADYMYYSYLKISNSSQAFRVDGTDGLGSDFVAVDHLWVNDYVSIAMSITGGGDDGTTCWGAVNLKDGGDQYYTVIQHSKFYHATEWPTECNTKEMIYFGRDLRFMCTETVNYPYVQYNSAIMYTDFDNTIGYTKKSQGGCAGTRSNTDGDCIDGKENTRYSMIWGNYFHDSQNGPVYGSLKAPSNEVVMANNYFKNQQVTSSSYWGLISLNTWSHINADADKYVFNNVFDSNLNNATCISVQNESSQTNTRIYNNTFYGINDGDRAVWVRSAPDRLLGHFYNNIVQNFAIGVDLDDNNGCDIVNDDNNFFYGNTTDYESGGGRDFPQGTIYTTDPGLNAPANGNFGIGLSSNARGVGTDLSAYFTIDNHDARDPTLTRKTKPRTRGDLGSWNIGAYECYDRRRVIN